MIKKIIKKRTNSNNLTKKTRHLIGVKNPANKALNLLCKKIEFAILEFELDKTLKLTDIDFQNSYLWNTRILKIRGKLNQSEYKMLAINRSIP